MEFKIERHKLSLQEFYPQEREIVIQADSKLLGIAEKIKDVLKIED